MNSRDDAVFSLISEAEGVDKTEVKRAVESYFGLFVSDAAKLPFDDPTKIFSKGRFGKLVKVRCIPHIGRLGPSYTRYLRWRANESKSEDMIPKPKHYSGYRSEDVEAYAESLLSGEIPEPPKKTRRTGAYASVWLVGDDGRKQAGQVITKRNKK